MTLSHLNTAEMTRVSFCFLKNNIMLFNVICENMWSVVIRKNISKENICSQLKVSTFNNIWVIKG